MKVLFIGGTGIISEGVSKHVIKSGMDLYLLNRCQRSELVPEGAKLIKGDIRDFETVSKVLEGYEFDVVVNWIAFTPEHVKTDIDLSRDKTRQYIFISSASAYQKPPSHYIITEATPLDNPYWQYSRDKIACEELLLKEYESTGFPATIVRPSLTYGDTMIPAALNSWHKPWSLIDRMRRGKKIIIHGDGTSLWTITHNSDFAKGIAGLFGNTDALGQAFHITSDEVLTWNQIYEAIADAAGVKADFVHISSEFIAAVSRDDIGNLLGDKAVSVVFDNSKIKSFVPGFKATIPFAEGVKESVRWFEAHPESCIVDKDWDILMDNIIAKYSNAFC